MSISNIGGKIYSNNPKNMNNVDKCIKEYVSVIITMETNKSVGDMMFYDGVKHAALVKRAHVLKHLHGRIIMGPFEICFHEGYLCRVHRAVIPFILATQFFVHLIFHGYQVYNQYIYSTFRTKYIDYNGTSVNPKKLFSKH